MYSQTTWVVFFWKGLLRKLDSESCKVNTRDLNMYPLVNKTWIVQFFCVSMNSVQEMTVLSFFNNYSSHIESTIYRLSVISDFGISYTWKLVLSGVKVETKTVSHRRIVSRFKKRYLYKRRNFPSLLLLLIDNPHNTSNLLYYIYSTKLILI